MSLVFSIPGKTFIAGEYLALKGGPTLVALLHPAFTMLVKKGQGAHPFHPSSPAGRFISEYSQKFSNYDLEFQDPFQGQGGFGASTAQFLGVYALSLIPEETQQDMEKLFDLRHLLEAYQKCAWAGEGVKPSGVDLVGQLKGHLTFFEKARGFVSVNSWPFADLEFSVIHTGNKLATHEHLKSLGEFDESSLQKAIAQIHAGLETVDGKMFSSGVGAYAQALQDLGFTCEASLKILDEIRQIPGVVAAKGCGAMGADVLFVVTRKGQREELKTYCKRNSLQLMGTDKDLSSGLQMLVKDTP